MGWSELPEHLEGRIKSDSPFQGVEKVSYNKYKNKKTIIDGIVFDSSKEAGFYEDLKLRKQYGDIKDFRRQVVFVLQDGFEFQGKKIRPITYIADFEIDHNDGTKEVVDIKSFVTKRLPVYKIKIKMLKYRYPNIIFTEVL